MRWLTDSVWVGNVLYPRWFLLFVALMVTLVVVSSVVNVPQILFGKKKDLPE